MKAIHKTMEEAIGEMTLDRLECCLSTMFEGAITYWAGLEYDNEEYKAAKDKLIADGKESQVTWELVMAQMLLNGKSLTLLAEDEDKMRHEFTLEVLKKGVEMWILNPQYHNGDEEWWEGDGEAIDILIQFAVFNDIIYG